MKFLKGQIFNGIIIIFLLSYLKIHAQTAVTVDMTNGGPQICVNETPVRPRMFWGGPRAGKVDVCYRWQTVSFEVSVPFEANATWHFRFGKQQGEIWLTDAKVIDSDSNAVFPEFSFATMSNFDQSWNIFPPDERNTVGTIDVVDSTVHVTLIDPPAGESWPDFHFWSKLFPLQAGKKYFFSFRVRAIPARSIYPAVYHVKNGWTLIGGVESFFKQEIKMAREVGVDFITFNVSNCWGSPEKPDDWEPIDILCRLILDVNPEALLIPRISMDAPTWWKNNHPDALMVYEDGSVGSKVSISSRQYREDAAHHLEKLCRHLAETFPNHLAGVHPCGQNTGEWFYEGSWGTKLSGYDTSTLQAWQSYPNGSSAIPTPAARRVASQRLLLTPELDLDVINFNEFLQEEMADFIMTLAAAARRGLGSDKIVLFFYGYHYEFGPMYNSPAASGHYALKKVLNSPDIDILCAPISYFDRGLNGSGPVMSSAESIIASGKFWINEDDTRTYLNTNFQDHQRYGGLDNLEQTQSVLLRNATQSAIRGLGTWWMDHGAGTGGGWFADPELWKVLDQVKEMDNEMLNRSKSYTPDIAVIIDEKSILHLAGGSDKIGRNLIYQSRAEFARCGVSWGQYMMEDLLNGNVFAPVQFFLSAWALTSDQREQLSSSRQPGVTRVWCYAPGYILPEKSDVSAMKSVSGFDHYLVELNSAVVTPTAEGTNLGINSSWGVDQRIQPLFSVEDDSCVVLATYLDQKPAVAMRNSDSGIDIFIGTPQLTSELIRAIARIAGINPIANEDVVVWTAEDYLAIHAVNDGPLTLTVSNEKELFDAINGQFVGTGPEISLDIQAGDTRLFKWESTSNISIENHLPLKYSIQQNYPNPFNENCCIKYQIANKEKVIINIYNILGEKVKTLINEEKDTGNYQIKWNGKDDAGNIMKSGVYLYKIQAGAFQQSQKMILLK